LAAEHEVRYHEQAYKVLSLSAQMFADPYAVSIDLVNQARCSGVSKGNEASKSRLSFARGDFAL